MRWKVHRCWGFCDKTNLNKALVAMGAKSRSSHINIKPQKSLPFQFSVFWVRLIGVSLCHCVIVWILWRSQGQVLIFQALKVRSIFGLVAHKCRWKCQWRLWLCSSLRSEPRVCTLCTRCTVTLVLELLSGVRTVHVVLQGCNCTHVQLAWENVGYRKQTSNVFPPSVLST